MQHDCILNEQMHILKNVKTINSISLSLQIVNIAKGEKILIALPIHLEAFLEWLECLWQMVDEA